MTVCRQVVNMSDVWGEFQSIFTYVQMKQYPEGCSKNEKAEFVKKRNPSQFEECVTNDVRDFMHACALCQRANPSNKAPPSTLHPVKVKQLFHMMKCKLYTISRTG